MKECANIFHYIINDRSEFFRGLSEKSEYERPSPAQPGPAHADAFERLTYISETVNLISIRSSKGDRSIQAVLITVGLGSFGGSLAGSACRVMGVEIGR